MLASVQGSTWRKARKEAHGWASALGGSWQRSPTTCSRGRTQMRGAEVPWGGGGVLGASLGERGLAWGVGLAVGASLGMCRDKRTRSWNGEEGMFPGSYNPLAGSHCGHHPWSGPRDTDLSCLSGNVFQTCPQAMCPSGCVSLSPLFNVCRADARGRIVPGTHVVPTKDVPAHAGLPYGGIMEENFFF